MAADPRGGDGIPAPLIICLCAVLLASFAAACWGQDAADAALSLTRALCLPLALVSERYASVCQALENIPPGTKDFAFAWEALNAVSRWYALLAGIPCVLLILRLGWRVSVSDVCRSRLDMRGLLARAAPYAPCVAPALNWPGGILAEPLDKGPWRAGRQPLQLAVENHLLLLPGSPPRPVPASEVLGADWLARADSPWAGLERDGLALDREQTRRLFAAQLEGRWQGWDRLPPYLKKLSGAWALFASDDKKTARRLLNELSLSFRAPAGKRRACVSLKPPFFRPAVQGHGYRIDTRLDQATIRAIRKALSKDTIRAAMAAHSTWRDTCLLALYERARTRGVLPTAEFIWLRPVNRRLYYLCNNVGRRTVWPEIAGAWAHYEAERVLAGLDPASRGIDVPRVDEAVNALEMALYEEGWISPDRLSEKAGASCGNLGLD